MLLQHLLVLLRLVLLEVREELSALRDLAEEAAAGGVVLFVILQVIGEEPDRLGEEGDLDLGAAGVLRVLAVLGDEIFLRDAFEGHRVGTRKNELVPGRPREFPSESADTRTHCKNHFEKSKS